MAPAKRATGKRTTRSSAKRGSKRGTAKRAGAKRAGVTRTAKSTQALSLHIGLNAVKPAAYGGWDGPLAACEFDANDMAAIAASRGMSSTVLLTPKATRAKVLAGIRTAARRLKSGGFFLLTYSGHGGQIPDVSGEEDDKKDETWCLFDGQLIDDELYLELSRFAAGVRVLVLSDSCHSGTVTRAAVTMPVVGGRSKMMPLSVGMRTYRAHQTFYDNLQHAVAADAKRAGSVDPDAALANVSVSSRLTAIATVFRPAVVLISGCQDNQTSMDGDNNGAFTEQLLRVWKNGAFTGNYAKFHATIVVGMLPTQTPNLFMLGPAATFSAQTPFTV